MPEASSSRPPGRERSPFFERGFFKGAVAVVGLLAAVWALTGAPKPWQVAAEINAGPVWLYNTAIIVDASAGMRERFDGKTKLAVAVDGVGAAVRDSGNENLALWSAGGSCAGEGDPLVDFGPDHGDDVAAEAAALRPQGRSNMVAAVIAAIDRFKEERFQHPGAKNRILVFMGAEDECALDPDSEIRRELARADIEASFQFFALRMSKKGLEQLRTFRREMQPYAEVAVADARSVREFEKAVATIGKGDSTTVEGSRGGPAPEDEATPATDPEAESNEQEDASKAETRGIVPVEEVEEGEPEAPEEAEEETVESETTEASPLPVPSPGGETAGAVEVIPGPAVQPKPPG